MSVPALVELAEVLANIFGKTDALRDPLGDLAVAGEDRHADVQCVGESLLDGVGQLGRRRVGKQTGEGADEGIDDVRVAAHIDAAEILAKRDLVAECRCEQMGVGVASDVAQQGLVIDLAAHVLVEAHHIGKPHGQHAGPQGKIA